MKPETNISFEQDITRCLEVLHNGGLILYPTDTIWGVGCDATNAEAVERIYKLKKRSGEKAMIVLVADHKDILRHVASPDLELFDYLSTLKQPTTVIYDGALGLADNLVGDDGSVAIRICQDPFCRQLIKRFRKPIVSTSPNISGAATPRSFNEITEDIRRGVDHIVEYRQNDLTPATPSKLIRWSKGSVEVIRQ